MKKKLFANFEVIDVNNYTKEELLTNKSLISKMMLLEKAKNIRKRARRKVNRFYRKSD